MMNDHSETKAGQPVRSGAPAGPVLDIRDVHKRFGGVHAVRGVSLQLNRGETVALLGENGAGKSTLVGMAAGRLEPDAGEIFVAGERLTHGGPSAAAAVGLRLVPQELLLCPDMTVLDNVLLGARPRTFGPFLSHARARDEASERLERLGVSDIDLGAPVASLTVVERAFVQIARSFTTDAKVLLIDEPTAPMDDSEVDRFLGVLQAVTREGVGIVYISHRLDEVFRLADRVAIMRDGGMVAQLSGAEITRRRVVAEMLGNREMREHTSDRGAFGLPALVCDGVSGSLAKNVDLTVHEGEIACVYGISGSGREELGGLIVGARPRSAGTVSIAGAQELRSGSVAHAVQHGVGYVPAERRTQGLILEASIAANITLSILGRLSRAGFLPPGRPNSKAKSWIAELQVRTPSANAPVGALSGGGQQKVLLARWLAAESKVLVLEEPTRGVDVATKADIYHLLNELARQGRAVLVITSDIEEATLVSERVMVMRSGQIVDELHQPTQSELALIAQGAMEDDHV